MPSGTVLSRWTVLLAVATAATACGEDEPAAEPEVEVAVAPATAPIAPAPAGTTAAGATPPAAPPATAPPATAPPATAPPATAPAATAPAATAPAAAPPATAAPAAGGLPAGVTQAMVQQGQQIYSGPGICFSCHGPNAQGGPLAPNLTDNQWLWLEPGPGLYDDLVTLIRTGVSEPKEHPAPMPAMGANLSDQQIRAVAAYIYSISQS